MLRPLLRWLSGAAQTLIFWPLIFWPGSPVEASTLRANVGDGLVAAFSDQQELFLEARPLTGEGMWAFSRRLTGGTEAVQAISQANGQPKRLEAGVRYRVPFQYLTDDFKVKVVRALFPDDRPEPTGWRHFHPAQAPPLTLWLLSEIFTGRGEQFTLLRKHNQLQDDSLAAGQSLTIQAQLLLPAFQALLPPVETPKMAADAPLVLEVGDSDLGFGTDGKERFAVYHLKRGEALYSAVVVRFTGRTFAEDVNALAAELATLNNIRDVTDMPIGQPIKIPLDLLMPEYLPKDDPRRQEYDRNRTEVAQYKNTVRATSLEGITIILDAGHGGDDPGADFEGVWESTYVYDVMLRAKALLEERTSAHVVPTTRDGKDHRLVDRDVLPKTRGHAVLTTPLHPIRDPKVATNLRWYLANYQFKELVGAKVDPGKVVFVSLHADSLHPTLRGAMAYVPSASLTNGQFGKSSAAYLAHQEVRDQPTVAFEHKERVRSEGLSRQLAKQILKAFRRQGLEVHREMPIRDRIVRCRRCRPFVPAVVRYNAVPTKLLLEICNLKNAEDRRLLTTRAFRQSVAAALVDGLLEYFGQPALTSPEKVIAKTAATRKP